MCIKCQNHVQPKIVKQVRVIMIKRTSKILPCRKNENDTIANVEKGPQMPIMVD